MCPGETCPVNQVTPGSLPVFLFDGTHHCHFPHPAQDLRTMVTTSGCVRNHLSAPVWNVPPTEPVTCYCFQKHLTDCQNVIQMAFLCLSQRPHYHPQTAYRCVREEFWCPQLGSDRKAQRSVSVNIHPVTEVNTGVRPRTRGCSSLLLSAHLCVFRADCLSFPEIQVL